MVNGSLDTTTFSKKGIPKGGQYEAAIGADIGRDVTSRLRVLEERVATDRKSMIVNEQNTIALSRKIDSEIKNIITELNAMKEEFEKMKDDIMAIIAEVKASAKKEEVKILEKYVELWEPLNFVTKNEVDNIVKRAFEARRNNL